MRTICIYHKNCFDGICAAWVVQRAIPIVELYAMNHGEPFPWDIPSDSNIIFVDFSLKRPEMEQVYEKFGGHVLVIDHHASAEIELKGLDYAVFDMKESGASLAWQYFFQSPYGTDVLPYENMPNLVRYVRDRDLWSFNEKFSKEINAYIQSFEMSVESMEGLYQFLETEEGLHSAQIAGKAIERYKDESVERMCKHVKWFILEEGPEGMPCNVPFVNCSILFSEVPDRLLKIHNVEVAGTWFLREDGKVQFGLRSRSSYDCSKIAKNYRGGGHKQAAGFQLDFQEAFMMILHQVFSSEA